MKIDVFIQPSRIFEEVHWAIKPLRVVYQVHIAKTSIIVSKKIWCSVKRCGAVSAERRDQAEQEGVENYLKSMSSY